ncbi:DNA phosphorothioation-dependent restriction protein DptG [Massilia sp. CFBP9012]|uniref:DNA phosphorothioation-dependent restriction protein DptG n=1 Tax=Massilia sp. CFBP9012 TaxID=3096531 RepID=UPI002A6A8EED|nr:DNA phosphorothioation-dependent restriction protein DptG [Massilia sp. CFBP9012]MDY0977713.1 DNA phosphorothioation-dependent restriction protein DptG [Massilia sp. CFBP9012]
MYPIANDLQISDKNKSPNYLPVRQKGNEFSWASVTGLVLGNVLQQGLQDYSVDAFRDECRQTFKQLLNDPKIWEWLDHMYFSSHAVLQASPLFLLFKAQKAAREGDEDGAANQRMSDMFAGLLGDFKLGDKPNDNLHFLEQVMLDVLVRHLGPLAAKSRHQDCPYLPFLTEAFQRDMRFLAAHPQYLVAELTNTLKLYAFSYCSQLSLSVRAWRHGAPQPKELYFILDVEKASTERDKIREHGYRLLASTSKELFPLLSASEVLQSEGAQRPLWQIYSDAQNYADQQALIDDLNRYIGQFALSRQLEAPAPAATLEDVFKQFVILAIRQFDPGKSERHSVNQRYVRELEKKVFAGFIQFRGRAGNILALNQDQLLLLTNLAIGHYDKLRFFELLREFQQRGFFFDNQSQQVLIEFFERMGNVERMSDSGEAVYVRKTV